MPDEAVQRADTVRCERCNLQVRVGPLCLTCSRLQAAESVAYEIHQPEGYSWSMGAMAPLPTFDKEGRKMFLLCHADGSVTWQLRAKDGEVLEP